MRFERIQQSIGRYSISIALVAFGLVHCFLLAFPAASQDMHPSSSDSFVTFYSNHITVLGGIPGHRWGAFKGRLFNGVDQLAFMEPAHFITFRIEPGIHVFTANSWINRNADHGAHITMNIQAGHWYFLETGSFATEPAFGIREVSCQFAQGEGADLKRLEPAHIRQTGQQLTVPETTFPPCPGNILNSP
jgi:hypothetical protein